MRPILMMLLLMAPVAGAAGQIPSGVEGDYEPHPEAEKAISQLLSPYCPGFMLEVCTAEESRVLRDSIHALAREGWTANELTGWMLARYGDEYLALPRRSGWALWAWILPPAALVLGLFAVIALARRFARSDPVRSVHDPAAASDPAGAPEGDGPTPEEEERLRRALRELELSEDPTY